MPFLFALRFITCIRVLLRLLVPHITRSELPARIHLTSQETASEVERHVICDVASKRLCNRKDQYPHRRELRRAPNKFLLRASYYHHGALLVMFPIHSYQH